MASAQQELLDHEAAVDLVQRLSEAAPDNALDVAVAVVEAMPDSAALVAAEVAGLIVEDIESTELAAPSSLASNLIELDVLHQRAMQTDAAIDLMQKLTEAAPDNCLDVAVAVVEAVPESAGVIASEVMNNLSQPSEADNRGNKLERAHQAAINTDTAIDLVQRLSEAAPDNVMDVAVAVVDVLPESASLFVDSISEGDESAEGEWMSRFDEAPREISDMDEPESDAKKS